MHAALSLVALSFSCVKVVKFFFLVFFFLRIPPHFATKCLVKLLRHQFKTS